MRQLTDKEVKYSCKKRSKPLSPLHTFHLLLCEAFGGIHRSRLLALLILMSTSVF